MSGGRSDRLIDARPRRFGMLKRLTPAALLAVVSMAVGMSSVAFGQATAQPAAKAEANAEPKALTLGMTAPEYKVQEFIKGEPITGFEKGKVYVVEFWATWCGPCIKAFPHLSEMQAKYKDKNVTFIGTNIWEKYDEKTLTKVKEFVAKQGDKMAYTVAYDGEKKEMDKSYMAAAGQNGIPCAFIVNQDGKVAWIGHPMQMEKPLEEITAGTYDLKAAVAAYEADRAKEKAAEAKAKAEADSPAAKMQAKIRAAVKAEKWDDALAACDEMVKAEPKAASGALMQKFNILIAKKKDYSAAYGMKDALLADSTISNNAMMLNQIAWGVVDPEGKVEKKDADFAVAIATQADKASGSKDPMIIDTLARAYWVKGDKAKAIELQEKAVKLSSELDDETKAGIAKSLDEYKGKN